MNAYDFELARARHQDLLREAARHRLVAEARRSKQPDPVAPGPRLTRVLTRLVPGRKPA
ncbi:MAG: hypothetical protein WB802_14725 [Candidatus Dormiibacterota bacterium]